VVEPTSTSIPTNTTAPTVSSGSASTVIVVVLLALVVVWELDELAVEPDNDSVRVLIARIVPYRLGLELERKAVLRLLKV
jgi:hypothetical protein